MSDLVTREQLQNAALDAVSLADVVNGADATLVTTRTGRILHTLAYIANLAAGAYATVIAVIGVATGWAPTLASAKTLYSGAVTVADGQIIHVACRAAGGDGYGGAFAYKISDSTTTFTQDGLGFVDAQSRRFFRIFDGVASVKWFGAKIDGSTDDTTAVNAALGVCPALYFPAGTCIASNLLAGVTNQIIFGDGRASVLQMKTGSTGALFSTNGKTVNMSNMRLYGGTGGSLAAVASSTADRTALLWDLNTESFLTKVQVDGFTNYGLKQRNSATDHGNHLAITDCAFEGCWTGIKCGPDYGEYMHITATAINGCRYGLVVATGNVTVANCQINDNGYNVYIDGTGIGNNSHGNVSNCLINHATVYGIYAVDVTNGHNFVGNNIFQGDIYLKNSYGITISYGIIDVDGYYFEGGDRNYIRDNYCDNTYTNIAHHNYVSGTSNTLFDGNHKSDGTLLNQNAWLQVALSTSNSTDQKLALLGEPGLPLTYGIEISGNASNGLFKFWGLNASVRSSLPGFTLDRATGALLHTTRTPASAGAAGVAGTIAWDASYIYVCTATNTWKRVAIATW